MTTVAGYPVPLTDTTADTSIASLLATYRPTHRTPITAVGLDEAVGRVLAGQASTAEPIPGFTRSAVDGFAVRAADIAGASTERPVRLTVTGQVRAGYPATVPVTRGAAVAIPTGGALPQGADAVVMVEDTTTDGAFVLISRDVPAGKHVIVEGDDVAAGEMLVAAGTVLGARHVGMLAAAGIVAPAVHAKPRVAIFSTGDEVVPAGTEVLAVGQVRDVNSAALAALVTELGGEPIVHPLVADELDTLTDACRHALRDADMLVISAGSSVGHRDLTPQAVERLGTVIAHGLAVRPGRPTLVADADGVPILGLPGNPQAAMVIFRLVGFPLLSQVAGMASVRQDRTASAILAQPLTSLAGRLDVVHVRLDGGLAHVVPGKPSQLSVMTRADGYVLVDEETAALPAGAVVDVNLYG